ncbi:hypothetical protein M9435_004021 [Picochlorum sp. BPE23]|nr:hypothetical protein M9435_004021 [Picochlorum sp. BPE23]
MIGDHQNAAGASSLLHMPLLSRERIEGRADAFDIWNERVHAQYSHEKDGQLLERLWNAAWSIGGDSAPQGLSHTTYTSDRWVDLGFQSDDPSRDFRGGGVLSLTCLVYMAESAPHVFHRLMAKTCGVRSEYEYPFAASCISVVFSLIDALKIRTLSSTHIDVSPSSYGFAHLYIRDEEAFEKIVMHTMLYLDEIWLSSSASYMDFPRIQKLVCAHVQRLVGKRWFTDPAMISSSSFTIT